MTLSNWNGTARPERVTLEGRYARLEPLDPLRHGDTLFASAMEEGKEKRFRFLTDAPPADRADFDRWLDNAAQSAEPLFFAVIDKRTGRAEGRQSLMRIDAKHGVIEIGAILWGPAIARTRVATEAFALFAAYVFETLGYRRFEWKCDDRNEPSKRTAKRFGFTFEGLFRNHMVLKGESRDTAWFSIIDAEWPVLSGAFAAWLDPANFDADGRQKQRLEALRSAR